MKKLTACVMAFAAMALTMTSCTKEENTEAVDLQFSVEENEYTNDVKTHLEGTELYWDINDQIVLYDAQGNSAIYKILEGGAHPRARWIQHTNPQRPFNFESESIYSFYPKNTALASGDRNVMQLPAVQRTNAGELKEFPMYGFGTFDHFNFKNVCGVVRFMLTGDVALDSIVVTTDKKVNGRFNVRINDLVTPLSYGSTNYGTKSVCLKFNQRLALNGTAQAVNVTLPALEYNVFDVTFYSEGRAYTMRNTNAITISRTNYKVINRTLNSNTFETIAEGTTNMAFSLGPNGNAFIAKGNLQYIGGTGRYWRIADNGFDCVGGSQFTRVGNTEDRDVFAWGANRYNLPSSSRYGGNTINIWPGSANKAAYGYLNIEEDLAGVNDWANNVKRNADNSLNWQTPSVEQMAALLYFNTKVNVTLDFVNVSGLLVISDYATITAPAEGAHLTKAQWNELVEAGAAFFPNTYYRNTDNTKIKQNLGSFTGSKYWTVSYDDARHAFCYDMMSEDIFESALKTDGCFVRPIVLL